MKNILVLSLFFVACRTTGSGSDVKHDLGRALNDASPYQWASVSTSDYFSVQTPLGGGSSDPASALPDDDPAARRMQAWLDRVDAMLRARSGHDFDGVPKPKGKIILSDVPNAFVAPIPVCLRLTANLTSLFKNNEAPAPNAKGKPQFLVFDRKTSNPELLPTFLSCLPTSSSQSEQQEQLRWVINKFPNCSLSIEGSSVTFAPKCLNNKILADIRASGMPLNMVPLAVMATSNQITFYSTLFTWFNEDEMVSVMTHELGHYYMAHMVTPETDYGFFYRLGVANPKNKPIPDPSVATLGAQILDAWAHRGPTYVRVPGAKLHSSFLNFFFRNIDKLSSAQCGGVTRCSSTCAQLDDYLHSADGKAGLKGIPVMLDPVLGSTAYNRYETLALKCSHDTPFASSSAVITSSDVMASVNDYPDVASLFPSLPSASTLEELLLTMSASVISRDEKSHNVLITLAAQAQHDLGYYTTEQEADELTTEWVDLIGIDPTNLVTAMIKFSSHLDNPGNPTQRLFGEVVGNECQDLYKNGWKDKAGSAVMIPVAAWDDIHHSSCYRAFNASREIQIFNETKFKNIGHPVIADTPWNSIVAGIARAQDDRLKKGPSSPSIHPTATSAFFKNNF